jgi:tRNA (guanine-N7-)-methyltransferase
MSRSAQLRVSRTKDVPVPNAYILALQGEFSPWSYDEERTPLFRGQWREQAFEVPAGTPFDVEIGTGNGLHFAHRAISSPERCILGLELRYKPLIQSIRRARRAGCNNARVSRYNAYLLPELFAPGEINDVFIFFPDPWEKGRNHKHRVIQDEFLARLFEMQRPGSRVFFKTDSQDYFAWAMTRFARSNYQIEDSANDLHGSGRSESNFITQFEQIFIRQGLPIAFARLLKG